jgi:hypothetical protein
VSGGTHSPCTRYEAPIEQASIESALREALRPPTGWGTCRRTGMRFFSIAPSVLPGTRRRPHTAPASELLPGPPTMAVLPSAESVTELPWLAPTASCRPALLGPDTVAAGEDLRCP